MKQISRFALLIVVMFIWTGCSISRMSIADVYDLNTTMESFSKPTDFYIVEGFETGSKFLLVTEEGINWPAHVRATDGEEYLLDAFDIDDDGKLELFLPTNIGAGAKVIFRSHDGIVRFGCTRYTAMYNPGDISEEEWELACVVNEDAEGVELVLANSDRYREVQQQFASLFNVTEKILDDMSGEIVGERAEMVLKPILAIIDVVAIVSAGFSAHALWNPALYSDLTIKYLWATAWTSSAIKGGVYSFCLYPSYWKGHLGYSQPTRWQVHGIMDRYFKYYHPDLVR
jgi:hypothetical protein